MTSLANRLVFCLAGFVAFSAAGLAQTTPPAAGRWEGTIKTERADLPIVVDLAPGRGGAWIGSMSATGSTSIDVPLGDLAVKGTSVRFTAYLPVLATFDGTLTEGGTISGTASSSLGETTFQLKRTGDAQVKVPPPSSPLTKEFTGSWEGTLEAGGRTRRIGLRLSAAGDGTAKGILIALDRDNLEIPFTTVTIKGKELNLETRALSGTFRGTLGADGEIAGEWDQGTMHAPLVFKPAAAPAKKA